MFNPIEPSRQRRLTACDTHSAQAKQGINRGADRPGSEAAGVVAISSAATGVRRNAHFRSLQLTPLIFQILDLHRARLVEPARANELNDATQFILVEPRAVLPTDVDDYVRAVGEIDAVHHVFADRAVQVTDFLEVASVIALEVYRGAQNVRLLFAIGINEVDGFRVDPQAFALRTFPHGRAADRRRLHVYIAARAKLHVFRINVRSLHPGAAVR